MGHFIFRLNFSFKPKLKPKFGLKPKLIRKIKWRQSSVLNLSFKLKLIWTMV